MYLKEIYKDGVLVEKHCINSKRNAFQLIMLGLMLLSVFVMVALKTVLQYYSLEIPCWLWIVEAISPIISVITFTIYEIIR